MSVSSGILTYDDVADVIEAIVNKEGRNCVIPGYHFDDIAQDIRLECIRVLAYYDASRIGPSPYKFLQTCIKNFLYNKRRGIWVPNNPPCVRCPFWSRELKTCIIEEVGCNKIVEYRKTMATKAAIRQPNSLEFEVDDNYQEESIEALILDESIRNSLSDDLIFYYEKMISGHKVPSKIKKQIRTIVTDIINNA